MYTCSGQVRGYVRRIDDEVPDLAEESVCGTEASLSSGLIWRAIDQAGAGVQVEVRGGADGRQAVRVADDLPKM